MPDRAPHAKTRLLAMSFSVSMLFAGTATALPRALTDLVDAYIITEADRESQRNQSDSTALADNPSTLVEHSSIPDFIGLAIDPGFLKLESDSEDERDNSYAGSITLNTIVAGLRGAAPGHEDFFYEGGGFQGFARGTAFIAGYDDPTTDDQRPAVRYGFKTRLLGDAAIEEPNGGFLDNGLTFLKTAPARILARPARSVFRPDELQLNLPENVPNCGAPNLTVKQRERCQFDGLRDAAKTARAGTTDDQRWGAQVCAGNAVAGKTLPQHFRIRTQGVRQDRLERAYEKAVLYLEHLICDGKKVRVLVGGDPLQGGWTLAEKRTKFFDVVFAGDGKAWARPARPTRIGGAAMPPDPTRARVAATATDKQSDRVELVFQELLDDVERWKATCDKEFSIRVGRSRDCGEELIYAGRARKALENLEKEGLLSPLGRAVSSWALGNQRAAIEALRGVIEGLGKAPGSAKQIARFRKAAGNLRNEINKRTEISFEYQASLRRGLEDRHVGTLVIEASPMQDCTFWGVLEVRRTCDFWRRLDVTINAGFDIEDDHETDEIYGGGAAIELSIPVVFGAILPGSSYEASPDEAAHRFSLSTRARWLEDGNDQYIGQAKFSFNLAEGVSIPLTFTVADRTALETNTDLRGQVGLNFDTSQFFDAFRQRLAPAANTDGS